MTTTTTQQHVEQHVHVVHMYGAWALAWKRCDYKTKERFRRAPAMVGRRDRMSMHRTAMAHTTVKIRSQSDDGVARQLHGRAPMEAAHAVTAAADVMD